eukprot:SAG11_NODE_6790_length_1248_cov_1.752829_2_plen_162_part_00
MPVLRGAAVFRFQRNVHLNRSRQVHELTSHDGDVYSVGFHPDGRHVVSGGYDHTVRVHDIVHGGCKCFAGHTASVTATVFNTYGNLVVSGSKDATVRVWDIVSGVSIHTIDKHLGEVTSVALSKAGNQLLTASKDNSNRLWDLRVGTLSDAFTYFWSRISR